MIVAYLVNQYPQVSHTFITREIAALEDLGLSVARYSLRAACGEPTDLGERDERARTRIILNIGAARLGLAFFRAILGRPAKFFRAARAAWSMGGRSERGRPIHAVYLVEACVLRRWLEQANATHLHAHFGTNSATVARLCRILGGPPYSVTIHGPEEFDAPRALSLREKIHDSEFVVAVSEFGRSQLWRWCDPRQWSKVRIVRCGVNAEFLERSAPAEPSDFRSRRFVCVGRLAEQKGQLVLIEAAKLLIDRGVEFQVDLIGDGPMRGAIESQIARFDLGDQIRLLGSMGPARVRAEILQSRGMVLPSFAEGLPVVLMESLALGRPVISTFVAGIPELVRDGENGYLVPAGSAEALAEAMQLALDAPADQLARMGEVGAETVRQRHDANTEAAILASYFFPDQTLEYAATRRPPVDLSGAIRE